MDSKIEVLHRYWIENDKVIHKVYTNLDAYDDLVVDEYGDELVYTFKINQNNYEVMFFDSCVKEGYYFTHEVDDDYIIDLRIRDFQQQMNDEIDRFMKVKDRLISKIEQMQKLKVK
jgi:hypothetical protein